MDVRRAFADVMHLFKQMVISMAFIPNDDRFDLQWHLLNDDPDELDLNVVDVWDDYDGSGVDVVAIDTGFDFNHQDFDNYRQDLDWDFEGVDDSNASPDNANDNHGTPVLGLIGAAQDGDGTVGIAFGADIIGYKTDWSRDEIAAGIERATDQNHDIVNMSYWNGSNMFSTGEQTLGLVDAIEVAAEDGRDGNGLIMVKSAGNGRGAANTASRAESTIESVNNMRETIVVAGTQADGDVHSSSSPGANVLVSGFYGGVQTTDRSGSAGYTNTDFTSFNGTSAAAPQVAGVIALMLEANPNLGWRDVQDILAYSARHVGSDVGSAATGNEQGTQTNGATWTWNDASNWNGGGLHFSNDYGFGLVDAEAAVRLAETWTRQSTSANEATPARVDGLDTQVTIANGSGSGGSNFFSLTFADGIDVENITLGINFVDVTDLGDLEVYLTSPGGTRIQLIADTGDTENYSGYWRFGATGFRGEDSEGTWRVEIRDDDSANTSPIRINDIDLWTYGRNHSNDDQFIFTNEFSDVAGVAGHSTDFAGGAGTDTLNTAAVDSAVIVNLQNGQGLIDGQAVTLSSIERVYTGVHQDIIYDGAGNQEIHSGRGNDIVRDTVSNGVDSYYLGDGNDWMQVYSTIGSDEFRGGAGRDRISFTQMNETGATFDIADRRMTDANGNEERFYSFEDLVGTANADTIIESSATNDIDGHDGNDTVIVTSTIFNDAFRGGDGRDMIDWSGSSQANGTYDLAAGTASANGHIEIMEDFEDFCGTNQADIIIESAAVNDIDAKGGDDLVRVTTLIGSDAFRGGFGTDTIDWSGSSQANGVYDLQTSQARFGAFTEVMQGFENFIGTNQADTVIEWNGINDIRLGAGDDTLEVNTAIGVDSFSGGFGIDTIDWSGSSEVNGVYDFVQGRAFRQDGTADELMEFFENFIGTDQADKVIEGNGPNDIQTGAGDDIVCVTTTIGVDSFNGGFGTDLIDWSGSSQVNGVYDLRDGEASFGASVETMFGFENIIGTNQADTIIDGFGANEINAGSGDDTVVVTTQIGTDSFTGGFGTDTIDWSQVMFADGVYDLSGGTATRGDGSFQEVMFGFENFIGTDLRDTLIEGAGANVIDMGAGNDIVEVNTGIGVDSFNGGDGVDLISWNTVSENGITFDLAAGTATRGGVSETMTGFEQLAGTQQNDRIFGSDAANILRGLGGEDRMFGRDGDDTMSGGAGRDIITGNGGSDLLLGEDGNDILRGGGGTDRLLDGAGADRLLGGAGADVFVFGTDADTDRLWDFRDGTDLIELAGQSFAALTISDMANGNVRVEYGTDDLIIRDVDGTLDAIHITAADFVF